MNDVNEFLIRHGPSVLFAMVFVEQAGLPLPSAPWLLAGGALIGIGKMNWLAALIAASLGSLLADMIWFYIGRYYGDRVLRLLCRISLEPDTCVRRTQSIFAKNGLRGIVVAKFIPGLSTVAPPMAGSSGMRARRFFIYDGLGSLLYCGCFILVGALFSRQLAQVLKALGSLGFGALAVVGGLFAVYIGYKYFQRQRLLRELRIARITVDELHQQQAAGENPIILDLRSQAALAEDPLVIRGARYVIMEDVKRWQSEIPRNREVVLYCSCPNEVSSAQVALQLRRNGIVRVRPLLGGIDAWRERNFPLEPHGQFMAAAPGTGEIAPVPQPLPSLISEDRFKP